ncbi:MAG: right-handed parallel beta-helix repeat-containing protein, partial [Candidatus Omnitrophica bacterium]|nr:right-handed parallel beta-helix repeat-containing protein [Candidatus Omnitrophota bacterium]
GQNGIYMDQASNVTIHNNTIAQNNQNGVFLTNNADTADLINNLISYHTNTGIEISAQAKTVSLTNNLLSLNNTNLKNNSSTAILTDNLIGDEFDPLFISLASKDYKLSRTSPAVNSGKEILNIFEDFDGLNRPLDFNYDIGAFEYNEPLPWINTFIPLREFYVSANGTGAGTSANPMNIDQAISNATAGDLYWLMDGTYQGAYTLIANGSKQYPIVFRAINNNQVTIEGNFTIKGKYNWIWGMEITDPDGISSGAGVVVLAEGLHLINNYIHHTFNKIGVQAWDFGRDHVFYGNIIHSAGKGRATATTNAHGITIRNSYENNGWKYFVNNILIDNDANAAYNFHAYSECQNCTPSVTGLYLESNIFANRPFIIGEFTNSSSHITLNKNYFYNTSPILGALMPLQAEFKNNYLGRGGLTISKFWGDDIADNSKPTPNIYTGNSFLLPPADHITISTAVTTDNNCEGCSNLDPDDVIDENTFSGTFKGSLKADNLTFTSLNINQWQNETSLAGKMFDNNSTEIPLTLSNKISIIPNDYNPKKSFLLIFNWKLNTTVAVDLSQVVEQNQTFGIYDIKDAFGLPLVSGNYNGPVDVPVASAEFSTYLIKTDIELPSPEPPPPPPPPPPSTGASYYVSLIGNDSNSGSKTSPWRTINKGCNTVKAGETLFIEDGLYNESVECHTNSGTSTKPITIKAVNSKKVTIQTSTGVNNLYIHDVSHIIVDGIIVKNAVVGFRIGNDSFSGSGKTEFITVKNSETHGHGHWGIGITGSLQHPTHNVTIDNVKVSTTNLAGGGGNGHGIKLASNTVEKHSSGVVIKNSEIYSNWYHGIQASVGWDDVTIFGCNIHDNSQRGSNTGGGVRVGSTVGADIYDNTFTGSLQIGVYMQSDSTQVKVHNNRMLNNRWGVKVERGMLGAIDITDNYLEGNTGAMYISNSIDVDVLRNTFKANGKPNVQLGPNTSGINISGNIDL